VLALGHDLKPKGFALCFRWGRKNRNQEVFSGRVTASAPPGPAPDKPCGPSIPSKSEGRDDALPVLKSEVFPQNHRSADTIGLFYRNQFPECLLSL
jgi:hypothetical protein